MSNSPDSLKGSPTVTPYRKRTNASGAWGVSPLVASPSTSRKWISPARTPPKRVELYEPPAPSSLSYCRPTPSEVEIMRTRDPSSSPGRAPGAPSPTPTPSEAWAADPWATSGAWPNPFLAGAPPGSPLVPYHASSLPLPGGGGTLGQKRAMLGAIHRQVAALQAKAALLEREILAGEAPPPGGSSPVLFDRPYGGEETVLRGLLSTPGGGGAGPTPTELSLWRGAVPGLFRLL